VIYLLHLNPFIEQHQVNSGKKLKHQSPDEQGFGV
jgi:hypothetical protein